MKNKGYTIPELLVVIAVLGIVSMIAIIKTSYAFSNDLATEVQNDNYYLIEKQAEFYGELNKDKFNENNEIFILAQDLVDANLLPVDENNHILSSERDLSKVKIKLTLKDDKITAKVVE